MTGDSGETARRGKVQRKQHARCDWSRSRYAEAQYSENIVNDYNRNPKIFLIIIFILYLTIILFHILF